MHQNDHIPLAVLHDCHGHSVGAAIAYNICPVCSSQAHPPPALTVKSHALSVPAEIVDHLAFGLHRPAQKDASHPHKGLGIGAMRDPVGGVGLVGFAPFEGGVSAPFAPHSVSAISTPMDRPISLVRHSAPPASGPVAVVAVILRRRGHVLHRPGRGIDRGGGLLGLVDHLDHLRGCELMHHVVGIAERDGL